MRSSREMRRLLVSIAIVTVLLPCAAEAQDPSPAFCILATRGFSSVGEYPHERFRNDARFHRALEKALAVHPPLAWARGLRNVATPPVHVFTQDGCGDVVVLHVCKPRACNLERMLAVYFERTNVVWVRADWERKGARGTTWAGNPPEDAKPELARLLGLFESR